MNHQTNRAAPAAQPELMAWDEAQRICDLPAVHEAMRNLLDDNTGDNATCLVREILLAAAPAAQPEPVNMILHCPNCGAQHIDAPGKSDAAWTNPPHKSHLCHACGCVWRPADVATNGVAALTTAGKADSWPRADTAAPAAQPKEQRLYRTDTEAADELLQLLFPDLTPDDLRTDGGSVNMPKVRTLLKERQAAAPAAQPDWRFAILREWVLAYPRMDIHAKPGTLVMFDGRGGYEMEQEHARKTLTLRGLYEVERITVHSSSSTVRLRGVDGEWNTVMFSKPPVSAPAAQPEPLTEGQLDGLAIAMCAFAGRATNPTKDGALEVLRAVVSHPRFAAQPAAQPEVEEMRARKDAAYEERNKVVAALARLFPSGIARTAIEGWSDDWHGCVYIDLPTGQVSWHFHDSQAHLFDGLPPYKGTWDGHDTPEKYRRLAALCASPAAHPAPAQPVQAEPVAWIDKTSLAELLASWATYAHVVHKCRTIEGDTPLYTTPPARDPKWVEEAMRLAHAAIGNKEAFRALRKYLES